MKKDLRKILSVALSIFILIGLSLFYVTTSQKEAAKKIVQIEKKNPPKRLQPLKYEGAMLLGDITDINDIINELNTEPSAGDGTFDPQLIANSVTQEALKAFSDSTERALPLIAHWNVGGDDLTTPFNPLALMDRLKQGEHVLASWKVDPYYNDTTSMSYYEASIKKAAQLHLPLVFIVPAPESALLEDNYFSSLDKKENPAVVTKSGEILKKLSPFGSSSLWNEVGEQWSSTELMTQLQEWYQNPPLVIFVSENEVDKLNWNSLNEDTRYTDINKDDNFKRTLIDAEWIEKYRQLHEGFKQGFTQKSWKDNVKFISYNKLSQNLGVDSSWVNNATYTNNYINIWPLTADGVTVDFDLHGVENDQSANAPHVAANNLPFMLSEAKAINPHFTYQLNINDNEKISNPARYRGLTQFALWFLRPSTIRQGSTSTEPQQLSTMFQEVADSVELIHYNTSLADFWKNGSLVTSGVSDLNVNVPTEYKNDPRWFLLNTDANPPRPWSDSTSISVWSFALVKGKAPNREWLLYAQSPEGDKKDVTITLPEYGDLMVDASEMGSFYVVKEGGDKSLMIQDKIAPTLTYPDKTTLTKIATANVAYPNYLESYIDPVFETKVTRITDSEIFGYDNPRHDYSRVQSWNSDSTYLRIRNQLLDGSTYKIIKKIPWLNGMRWSHSNPNTIYGLSRGDFKSQNVLTEKQSLLYSFKNYDKISMGEGEGSISTNDEIVVFTAKKDNDLTVIVFNIKDKRIISQKTYPSMWDKFDWVSISPKGDFVVFAWQPEGVDAFINDVYDTDQNFLRRLDGKSAHSDICIDTKDNEVLVKFQYGTGDLSDASGIWSYRLDDNSQKTQLLPSKYNGGHVSCKNYKRDGWAYISTKQEGYKEVFALKLDNTTNGTVERFVQHHSSSATYKAEPQASPNPDGTKIIFASDWEGTQDDLSFIVEPLH